VSRGEECRLALHLAGIDFEDVRIIEAAWPSMKEQMPYGALPVLAGDQSSRTPTPSLCSSVVNTAFTLPTTSRQHHEGMMQRVEDLRAAVVPTIGMGDAEKRVAREALVAGFLPASARYAERNIPGTPFFSGAKAQVVDLKLHMAVR
jgi:hypothetical protein